MTVMRRFKVHSRLRAALMDGKGLRASEALARAEAGMQGLAEACAETIRGLIAGIDSDFGPGAGGREAREPLTLYRDVARIIESAVGEADGPLVEAAVSFCDLLDGCAEDNRWDWPAVDVHIQTLKLLAGGSALPDGASRQLLDQLAALRQHREQARA
jgi:hypothetical protein